MRTSVRGLASVSSQALGENQRAATRPEECLRDAGMQPSRPRRVAPVLDPTTKSFHMSVSSGKSIAAYRAEAAKCVLVCANCHGEIEMGLLTSPTRERSTPASRAALASAESAAVR